MIRSIWVGEQRGGCDRKPVTSFTRDPVSNDKSQGGSGSDAGTNQALKRGVASAICALRDEARLSRKGLAERSGLSYSWISQLESGKHEPTYGSLRCLAHGLGIPMSSLVREIEIHEQS